MPGMISIVRTSSVLTIASGMLGFTGIAGYEGDGARVVFLAALYLCTVTAFLSGLSGNPPFAWLRSYLARWQPPHAHLPGTTAAFELSRTRRSGNKRA